MRVVFFGTPEFALPALRSLAATGTVALVVTQPNRPSGRRRELRDPPVARAARALGLPVTQPDDVNGRAALRRVRDACPDVLVVVAYGRLIGRRLRELCPPGVLNLHPSLLPAYRGAAPVQMAIYEGRSATGVTLMRLDEGIDTGPIVAARSTPIGPRETAPELHDRLAALGAELLVESLPDWLAGRLAAHPQHAALATVTRPLARADGELDVRRPAARLFDQWRAFQPWPGAHVRVPGLSCKLLRVGLTAGTDGEPGDVSVADQGLQLSCATGALLIERIQPAGGRAMDAGEFVNGYRNLLKEPWGRPYPAVGEPLVRRATSPE